MSRRIILSQSEKNKIKINQMRREWQAEMANDIKSLKERVTKLENKNLKKWKWPRFKKKSKTLLKRISVVGIGKKRTKRKYKKKKRKYKKKRTKKKSHK